MALRTLVRDGAGPGPQPVSERGFAGLLLHPNHYYSINVTYPVVVTVVNLILASRSGIKNIIKKKILRALNPMAPPWNSSIIIVVTHCGLVVCLVCKCLSVCGGYRARSQAT